MSLNGKFEMIRSALVSFFGSVVLVTIVVFPAFAICDVAIDMSGKWTIKEIETFIGTFAGGDEYELEISRSGSRYQFRRSDGELDILEVKAYERHLSVKGDHAEYDSFEMVVDFDKDMGSFKGWINYTQIQPRRAIEGKRDSAENNARQETKAECLRKEVAARDLALETAIAKAAHWQERFIDERGELEIERVEAQRVRRISQEFELELEALQSKLEKSGDEIKRLRASRTRADRITFKLEVSNQANGIMKTEIASLQAKVSTLETHLRDAMEQQADDGDMETLVTTLRRNLTNEANRTRVLDKKVRRFESDNNDLRRRLLAARDRISNLEISADRSPRTGQTPNEIIRKGWPNSGKN